MQPIALTIPEACEFSGLGRSTIYRLFEQGALTPRKAGRRTLILREDLEGFIRNLPAAKAAE
jgi:excisionase family DNA binding protein